MKGIEYSKLNSISMVNVHAYLYVCVVVVCDNKLLIFLFESYSTLKPSLESIVYVFSAMQKLEIETQNYVILDECDWIEIIRSENDFNVQSIAFMHRQKAKQRQ